MPEHYRRIDRLLQDNDMAPLPADAAPVRISSWMGGDRDGNPNVTAGVMPVGCRWKVLEFGAA